MTEIASTRLVAVIRSRSADEATRIGEALIAAGVTVVEVAFTTPGADQAVRRLAGSHPDAVVGAGTVLDEATARLAILAGARLVVSPSLSPAVVQTCHRYGVAAIPGAHTATEIVAALAAGADAVKLFPAEAVGPAHLRALLAAVPQAPIIPTGGVSASTARQWLDAGAVAVGIGGALTSGSAHEAERLAEELLATLGPPRPSRGDPQAG